MTKGTLTKRLKGHLQFLQLNQAKSLICDNDKILLGWEEKIILN